MCHSKDLGRDVNLELTKWLQKYAPAILVKHLHIICKNPPWHIAVGLIAQFLTKSLSYKPLRRDISFECATS